MILFLIKKDAFWWQRYVYNNFRKTNLKQLKIHYLDKLKDKNIDILSLLLLFALMIKISDITTKTLHKLCVKIAK
jgi:hypothetical protein